MCVCVHVLVSFFLHRETVLVVVVFFLHDTKINNIPSVGNVPSGIVRGVGVGGD